MKENMREHLFNRGELRSPYDPFKSEWRRNLEAKLSQPLPVYVKREEGKAA